MRDIRFRSLLLQGFKSFRSRTVFNLYPSCGLHFLSGDNQAEPSLQSNGAGKSSVLDAFCWVIKGRTLGGLRSPDLQSWDGNDTGGTKIVLTFDCDDDRMELERTANPNTLSLNGTMIPQEEVDALFCGLSLEAIGHTIVHGQDREFFFDLSPARKMELLSEVLDLKRWEERSMGAAALLARIEQKTADLHRRRQELDGRRQEVSRSLDEAQRGQTRWGQELQVALRQLGARIKEEESVLARMERRLNEARLANDGSGTERVALEREITQLTVYREETVRQLIEKQSSLRGEQEKLAELKQSVKIIEDKKCCPLCQQGIDKRRLLPGILDNCRHFEERLGSLRGEIGILSATGNDLEKQLDQAKSSVQVFCRRESEAQSIVDRYGPETAVLQAGLRALRNQRDEQAQSPNPYLDEVRNHRQRRDDLDRELMSLNRDIERLDVAGERANFWIKGFKDIRLYIVEELLAQMQLLADSMLAESGLIGWSLEYVSERPTKSDTVRLGIAILVRPRAGSDIIRWESFCGGERQRLRLIGSRALAEALLNRIGLRVNLEFFDEPTSSLSPRGVDNLIDMLVEQARWTDKAIFFVDHHTVESDRFASVVRVVRDQDGSRIE